MHCCGTPEHLFELNNLNHLQDDQLKKIYELCGTPNEDNWHGVSDLHYFDHAKEKL